MNDKQKTLQIEIHLIIDRLQNGLIHPMTAKKLLYESANKALIIADVSNCPFEAYAVFCIECDRQGMKPIKYKDCLNLK
jgi:hypothetical protein